MSALKERFMKKIVSPVNTSVQKFFPSGPKGSGAKASKRFRSPGLPTLQSGVKQTLKNRKIKLVKRKPKDLDHSLDIKSPSSLNTI